MTKPNISTIAKFVILIIIVITIAGIWVVKNKPVQEEQLTEVNNSEFGLNVPGEPDMEKLKSYGLPIIIDFGADSCIPCKEMAPVLKELNNEFQSKAIIKFVDVWKYPSLADDYPVRVIPTQIFIGADGKAFIPKDPDAMQMKLYSLKDTGEHAFTTHEGGMTKERLLKVLKEMGVD